MRIHFFKILLVVLCMLSLNGLSFAQNSQGLADEHDGWRTRMESRMQELFNTLNLTQEQKKLLEDNKLKNRNQMDQLRKKMRDLREQMRHELQAEDLDMQKINAIQSEMKNVQGDILDHRLTGILEVRKILTPDQFQKFSEEMQKHRENYRKKMWGNK